jgi:hypothetical protein
MWRIELPSTPAALKGVVVSPAATVVDPVHPAEGTAATFAGSSTVVVVLAAAVDVVFGEVAALLFEQAPARSMSAKKERATRGIVRP